MVINVVKIRQTSSFIACLLFTLLLLTEVNGVESWHRSKLLRYTIGCWHYWVRTISYCLCWFVENGKKRKEKKFRPPSYQFAIKHGLLAKQTNQPSKKKTKNSETMRFFAFCISLALFQFTYLSFPFPLFMFTLHDKVYLFLFLSLRCSLARCETFIYNILLYNKTWTNMSSTWFWYDVFIFLSSFISKRSPSTRMGTPKWTM